MGHKDPQVTSDKAFIPLIKPSLYVIFLPRQSSITMTVTSVVQCRHRPGPRVLHLMSRSEDFSNELQRQQFYAIKNQIWFALNWLFIA